MLKWVGIVVAGLVALLVVAILVLILLGSRRISKDYDIQVASVPIPTDAVSIERGRHYVETEILDQPETGERLGPVCVGKGEDLET